MYKNEDARRFELDIDDRVTERQRLAESFALANDVWANKYYADTSLLLEELRQTRLAFQEVLDHALALIEMEGDHKDFEATCDRVNDMCSMVTAVDKNGKPLYNE